MSQLRDRMAALKRKPGRPSTAALNKQINGLCAEMAALRADVAALTATVEGAQREAWADTATAARLAQHSERWIRQWVHVYGIGRSIKGRIEVYIPKLRALMLDRADGAVEKLPIGLR